MSPSVLEVRGAVRRFGARAALDGVDLSLEPGEIYALLGPNGAGKSTLVRAVCGRVRLDAGSITLCGKDPRRDRAARRRLGLVPQEIALWPELTGLENLELLGRLAGLGARDARARAREGLEWADLAERGGERAGRLSGGQRRRLNLVAGALHRPDVLLLDEPTVGVDPEARERLHGLLRDLRARGMALLLATHDLDQAAELADRIGVLVAGRVRAEGTLSELVGRCFGASRELVLALAHAAPDAAEAELRALGLVGTPGGRLWSGPLEGDLARLPQIERHLREAGASPTELRLREPSLRGVFLRLAGREFEAEGTASP